MCSCKSKNISAPQNVVTQKTIHVPTSNGEKKTKEQLIAELRQKIANATR